MTGNPVLAKDDFMDYPNVEQYVQDGSTSMSTLARTEQKLGYMGDIDDLRWHLYKCTSLDVGAGVILGGLDCEQQPETPSQGEVSEAYKKLQEAFSGTKCEQNGAWEAYTASTGGTVVKAGVVNCSALAAAYCASDDKEKAQSNISNFYDCTKNGAPISCVELAETYCTIVGKNNSESESGGSSGTDPGTSGGSSGMTEEEQQAAAEAEEKKKQEEAENAVSNSSKRKCIVNGVEVSCSDLAEANEIRKKTDKESNFEKDKTECYADVICKDENGALVSCKKARDTIQCGKSSTEGLSLGYSCYVGGEEVDCSLLGDGKCTTGTCNAMCPDYGGMVSQNMCVCYEEPICTGPNQTGSNYCPLGGKPKKNGTPECACFSEAKCSGSDQYYWLDGEKIELKPGDSGYCSYGGICTGQENNYIYQCSTDVCPYGSTKMSNGKIVFDPKNCPYGSDDSDESVTYRDCTNPKICPYGGVNNEDGSCACNPEPVCSGALDAQTGINKCVYGGKPASDGTLNCVCNDAPKCSSVAVCPYGGSPKRDGTQSCECEQAMDCSDPNVCLYGGKNISDGSCLCNSKPSA